MPEYSEEILDSNSISSTDKAGRPIPVTIPIALAPGIKVVYTTLMPGASAMGMVTGIGRPALSVELMLLESRISSLYSGIRHSFLGAGGVHDFHDHPQSAGAEW